MAEVLGLVGFVSCETSGKRGARPLPGPSLCVTVGKQLIHNYIIIYIFKMRVIRESPGFVRRRDRAEPLRGCPCAS